MSLNGNLEDLPLLDILQIVSFSKKTGFLSIRNADGAGGIVFQDGFVVAAFAWDSPPLDPRAAQLGPVPRGKLLRGRIEMALEQLIRMREGGFSFSLTEQPPASIEGRDISGETLPEGINAQELLLDLARGMDEDRRDSTAALEASFAEPASDVGSEGPGEGGDGTVAGDERSAPERLAEAGPTAEPADEAAALVEADQRPPVPKRSPTDTAPIKKARRAAAPPAGADSRPVRPALLLVDDEDDIRRVLGEHFSRAGFEVVEAEDPDTALKKAVAMARDHRRFLLVTDLGMPTSGGTSFQGGFEVVKRLAKMNLRPPVLMMTQTLSAATQTRARQMGVRSFVFKPGLSKLDPEQFDADLRAFAHKIVSDILPRLERAVAAPPPAPTAAVSPGAASGAPPAADALTREFAALQKWMHELRKPQDPTQISQLVVRVAREFFERGVLFVVKNEEIRGITGFGPAPEGESLHLLARAMAMPMAEPSPFENVVASQKPFTGVLAANRWTDDFYDRVGRFQAHEAALLPLLTNRETIALLYGDNAQTGRALRRLDGLEVFINQAGIALENAFLQRKVHALQGQE